MSIWNNKTIPFWQEIVKFPNKFVFIWFSDNDPRFEWPESFKPSISSIINEISKNRTSYITFSEPNNEGSFFVNILAGKIIISGRYNAEKNQLFLNKKNGFEFATNFKKNRFIRDGIRISHEGIFVIDGYREFNSNYGESYIDSLKIDLLSLKYKLIKQNTRNTNSKFMPVNYESEFSESESSKIEEILETLEAYVNKEYEIEDAKARAEKPFVYTDFKAEDIASTYKYYYRITLLKEDAKRLRELALSMLQIKKTDETFMNLEIYNIKPNNAPNDIIVTTSFQTDRSMIDSSNELYLAAIPTLQKVRQRVIDDLRGKVSLNKWLIPLAAGVYSFDKTIPIQVPRFDFEEFPRLRAQDEAIAKGAGSRDITLTLGPPGTGKTTIILAWAKYYASRGKKILITSQNNKAVDNVLERLAKEKDLECIRVGNESKVSSSIHDLLIENYAVNAQKKLVYNLNNVDEQLIKIIQFFKDDDINIEESSIDNKDNIAIREILDFNTIKSLKKRILNYKNSSWLYKIFFWFNYKLILSKYTKIIRKNIKYAQSVSEVVTEWKNTIQNERQSSLYETILENVDVVGATCIGINSNRLFADIPFDVVIVDESGQIQLHNLMVPLSRASKAILVGDHKQLPPVVDDGLVAELEEQGFDPVFLQKSWFEILWDPMPEDHKTMLDTQFRCPTIISDFVSKAFYENKYFAGSGMEKKQPVLPSFNSTMTFIDTSKVYPNFEQSRITDGRTEVLGNEVETKIIIKIFKNFLKELPYLKNKNNENLFEIAIIVPYKNHVDEIKKEIKKEKIDIGEIIIDELVASVDSFQGQEKDVIIFAFSRSNKAGNIGFLADWRRLNVAVTRTKKQLIMIGNLNTLTKDNKKEHEAEFKQAMRILEDELRAKDSIIDGRNFVNGVKK